MRLVTTRTENNALIYLKKASYICSIYVFQVLMVAGFILAECASRTIHHDK